MKILTGNSLYFASKISGLSVDVYGLHINENKQTKIREPDFSKLMIICKSDNLTV
jgi:hypothetical protein